MIKVEDTVIADVTMRCSLWSEDHARLTELESVDLGVLAAWVMIAHIQEEYPLRFGDDVLIPRVDPRQ